MKENSKKVISILGLGWLGLPLAETLAKDGYQVKGSVRSRDKALKLSSLSELSLFVVNLAPRDEDIDQSFFDCDVLIIGIPPRVRRLGGTHHLEQVQGLLDRIGSQIKRVVYLSSTSVYPKVDGEYGEDFVLSLDPNNVLIEAENRLSRALGDKLTILRLAGLMGYDRYPAKYYSEAKPVPNPDQRLNYVHRDDVIGVIRALLAKNSFFPVLNVVAPEHPTRKEVVEANVKQLGLDPRPYGDHSEAPRERIICSICISSQLGYVFRYTNPSSFFYSSEK